MDIPRIDCHEYFKNRIKHWHKCVVLPPAVSRDTQQTVTPRNAPIESVHSCKIPALWKSNPDMWLFQVESVFQANNVRLDTTKYHLAVSALTPETLLTVTDIITAPPPTLKFLNLEEHLISRLCDSANRQLCYVREQQKGNARLSLVEVLESGAAGGVTDQYVELPYIKRDKCSSQLYD